MAVKNISKINSVSLLGLTKSIPKYPAPYRNVSSSNICTTLAPITEPNHSKYVRKCSATSMIKVELARKGFPISIRRLENQLAAERVRKSNTILEEYCLQKRRMQEQMLYGIDRPIPTLSKKLMDIMSNNANSLNTSANPNSLKDLFPKRFYGTQTEHTLIDYKPQSSSNLNRWHMKVPKHRLKASDEQQKINKLDTSLMTKHSRKVAKIVKPPENKVYEQIWPFEHKEREILPKENERAPTMWYLGGRHIPRLDL